MTKTKLLKLLGFNTYEEEYDRLVNEFENLKREYETVQAANNILACNVIDLEDEVELLATLPNKYAQVQIEKLRKELDEDIRDKNKRAYNRGFTHGRASMCSEYGIWRLDAQKRGNALVRLNNDFEHLDIVELIADDLVDVKEPPQEPKIDVLKGEIIIDDLQDIGA